MELTVEQKRAVAMASARARMAEATPAPVAKPASPKTGVLDVIGRRGNEGLQQIQRGAQEWAKPDSEFGPLQGLGDIVGGGFKAVAAPISGYVERAAGPAWNAMTGGPTTSMGDFSDNMLGVALGGPKPKPVAPLIAASAAPVTRTQAMAAALGKPRAFLDAGATPAAEKVRSAAMGTALNQWKRTAKVADDVARVKAADKPLRATMEARALEQAQRGVGVSDIPEAQSLVANLKGRLNPTGDVVTIPTADQAKVYQAIIDTLTPVKGQRPSLETVQNLRRQIQEPVKGDISGFGAVNKIERQKLADELHAVEDAYTGGAAGPVRENYKTIPDAKEAKRAAKQAEVFKAQAIILDELPPAESVKRAQGIVDGYLKKNLISEAEYKEFTKLANEARTLEGKAAFRKRLALWGAAAAGLSATDAATGGHIIGSVLP